MGRRDESILAGLDPDEPIRRRDQTSSDRPDWGNPVSQSAPAPEAEPIACIHSTAPFCGCCPASEFQKPLESGWLKTVLGDVRREVDGWNKPEQVKNGTELPPLDYAAHTVSDKCVIACRERQLLEVLRTIAEKDALLQNRDTVIGTLEREIEKKVAQIAELQDKLKDARYLGDNHHNAKDCPYCQQQ